MEIWGCIPLADAIRKATRHNLDLEEGRIPLDGRVGRETTVAYFVRDVWLKKKATEVRPKSLSRYRAVMEHFIEYLETRGMCSPALGTISYEIATDYLVHRASTPLMPNGQKKFTRAIRQGAAKKTVHFEREILFQVFKEAVRRELVKHNPFADVHPKKPSPHEVAAAHHPLTQEEEDALLRASAEVDRSSADNGNPRFHDMVLFLVRTGLREDEMRHLEWGDIDWKEGLICVRQKRVEETRVVPIPATAVRGLKKLLAGKTPQDPVFEDDHDIVTFGVRLNIRRKQDMLEMKAGDVDLAARRITTSRTYVWKPKGTNGVVPMCAAVRSLLAGLAEKKAGNFVFAHRDGGACRVDLLTLLKVAKEKAGIKGNLRIHDLRHTLAFRLRRDKGVSLEAIMGILRHADIRETLIYAPYSLEEGRTAIARLDVSTTSPTPSALPEPAISVAVVAGGQVKYQVKSGG
jgi:integrase